MRRAQLVSSVALVTHAIPRLPSSIVTGGTLLFSSRNITTSGRVTNEDRRWWLMHLECAPDVHPGTFIAWLDCCGTHTTKKLIERNIWTIEQIAALDSEQVDELKYQEGCIKMDVVWEHARTIITALKNRQTTGGVESDLQSKILELRKKRELDKKRSEIISERTDVMESREATLQKLREAIAAKKEELLKKQQRQQQQDRNSTESDGTDVGASKDEQDLPPSVDEAMSDIADRRR